ncbi:uncharacterized protein LOC107772241 isoform X2 [Nicotiana tabacum]|uniref:Uncharacterized protein LOC107772241 isoform X2 n=1 Tax=Nicotiana tabacum TaxID=4097 RepID=A0A1S3Y5Q1_TOBAC|nr:PREDICTED: uncharacterized protein LOC107772241 isoform X3 [Nicotiana tabacum]
MRKYKTRDALLKNRPSRIPRDQWSSLVSYWLSDKAKRCTQANRNNGANQMMSHTGVSKSIATLMDESSTPTTAMNEYHKHQGYLVLLKILHFLTVIQSDDR